MCVNEGISSVRYSMPSDSLETVNALDFSVRRRRPGLKTAAVGEHDIPRRRRPRVTGVSRGGEIFALLSAR